MIVRLFVRLMDQLIGWRSRFSDSVEVGARTRLEWRRIRNVAGNRLRIGSNSIVNATIAFEDHGGEISIGDRCFIGHSKIICYRGIKIGDDVIISWGVTVVDHDSHSLDWDHRQNDVVEWAKGRKTWDHVPHKPVIIEDKVWIGFDVSILKGVTIGEGAVIGACSVVTKDVTPYSVVAGNPARDIRKLAPETGKTA